MKEIVRLWKALGYSLEGMKYLWKTQKNARLLFSLTALALVFGGFIKGISKVEFALLIFSLLLITVTETVNTAIEHTLDIFCGGNFHPGVKIAKDVASAAVFMTIINAIIMVIIIFFTNALNEPAL